MPFRYLAVTHKLAQSSILLLRLKRLCLERHPTMIDRDTLEYVLNRIRPQIQADGGDIEITEVDDEKGIVYVALQGACVDCPLSALTLSDGVERVLVEHVPGVKKVLPDMQKTIIHDPMTGEDQTFENSVHVIRLDDDGNVIEESTMPAGQ